jgi:hypothetical protein
MRRRIYPMSEDMPDALDAQGFVGGLSCLADIAAVDSRKGKVA